MKIFCESSHISIEAVLFVQVLYCFYYIYLLSTLTVFQNAYYCLCQLPEIRKFNLFIQLCFISNVASVCRFCLKLFILFSALLPDLYEYAGKKFSALLPDLYEYAGFDVNFIVFLTAQFSDCERVFLNSVFFRKQDGKPGIG